MYFTGGRTQGRGEEGMERGAKVDKKKAFNNVEQRKRILHTCTDTTLCFRVQLMFQRLMQLDLLLKLLPSIDFLKTCMISRLWNSKR